MAQSHSGGTDGGCKVDRVREKYNLRSLDDRVLRQRQNKDASLRDLESYINKLVLKTAMEQAGMKVLDDEESNYYRLLTSDDVIDAAAKEARNELERNGIDVDELEEDFVSYQTVRKHLNDCLDTSTSEEYTPDIDDARDTFGDLKERTKNVVSRTINRLRKYGMVKIGEPDVIVSIKLRCGNCGRTHDLYDFMTRQECQCMEDQPAVAEEGGSSTTEEPSETNPSGENEVLASYSGDGSAN